MALNNNTRYKIYTITCPIKNQVIYVGLTNKPIEERLNGHMYPYGYNERKCEVFANYRKMGIRPIIEELETFYSRNVAKETEIYWINQFKQWGFDLLNSDGLNK
jgi:hypothetical protein